jgi:hypothetical protein
MAESDDRAWGGSADGQAGGEFYRELNPTPPESQTATESEAPVHVDPEAGYVQSRVLAEGAAHHEAV